MNLESAIKLLIVEGDQKARQALTAAVHRAATQRGVEIGITEAWELNGALPMVPLVDTILSDDHFPIGGSVTAFDQRPWLAVYAMARPSIDLGKKRFAPMTGDRALAAAVERKHLQVFRKPVDFQALSAWLFARSGKALAAPL